MLMVAMMTVAGRSLKGCKGGGGGVALVCWGFIGYNYRPEPVVVGGRIPSPTNLATKSKDTEEAMLDKNLQI